MSVAEPPIVTLRFPESAVADVQSLSASLVDRMHELLERNADAPVGGLEREELEALVRMAQFGQLVSMALTPIPPTPMSPTRSGP